MCACVCVCACMPACVHACMRACVRVCVREREREFILYILKIVLFFLVNLSHNTAHISTRHSVIFIITICETFHKACMLCSRNVVKSVAS